jgi:large subunit ribosomal protein L1
VTEKNTIAEIEAAIQKADSATPEVAPQEALAEETEAEKFTKAGKHSKKAAEEAEALAAKEERKAKIAAGELDPTTNEEGEVAHKRGPVPIPRPLAERRSKRYQATAKEIDANNSYDLGQAVDLVKKTSTVKFDASVELHINLNVDPKHADQNIRGSVVLPNGTGKSVRVAVFADDEGLKAAKAAGADGVYGEEEFMEKMNKGEIDFDVLISIPKNMPKLGKFAKVLGPKGLMPNPKSGTVTTDVAKAVTEAKAGRVEYRVDKSGIIHTAVGKVSFDTAKLTENAEILLQAVKDAKPASIKNEYIQSIYLTSSMGPSVRVQ